MQSVGRRYAQYFNRTYHRSGSLWEGRYKSALVDTERYLLACYRYIELNPVRAGIVRKPEDYPYSSYQANGLGKADHLSGFIAGGPNGDNGLAGKNLVVDACGPTVPTGGGAWSNKDFHRVDRLGGMLARELALWRSNGDWAGRPG